MKALIYWLLLLTQNNETIETTAQDPHCGMSPPAQSLATLIINHPAQQRAQLQCHKLLVEIANNRAQQLLAGTTPERSTPNQILIKGGYRFASFYPPTGNQVEAVAKNQGTPAQVMQYLSESAKHQDHVLGKGEFFSRQKELGVGYHQNDLGQTQYVVLIAEPHTRQKVVFKQTINPPKMVTRAKCSKNWRHSKAHKSAASAVKWPRKPNKRKPRAHSLINQSQINQSQINQSRINKANQLKHAQKAPPTQ